MSSRKSPGKAPERLLTEVELELMTILWQCEGGQGGTVGEVQGRLPAGRPLAYTSISTILRILEQKGVVRAEKIGRGHRYVPRVSRDQYQALALEDVVGRVFDGQPMELVRRLVDAEQLDDRDIAALKALIMARAKGSRS